MSDVLNLFSDVLNLFREINTSIIIFFMLFSLGIALFHTMLLGGLYNLKFPNWLFFVLNPALIGIGYLIYKPLGGLVLLILFLSVFLLAIIGMFYTFVRDYIEEKKESDKINKKKTPWWKIILGLIGTSLFLVVFFLTGPYAFVLIIAFIIITKVLPNSTNQFLQLQSVLPTSSIRSMAMGLVEVKGEIKEIEFLSAPINSKQCIGYRYTIEDVSTDSDGDDHYSTIKDITVCNNFYIVDDTAEVEVKGEGLEFLWVEISDRHNRGGKRYTQYLIKDGDEMLLIGKASTENHKTIIEKETIKKVFIISPVNAVNKWNKNKPLLKSFIIWTIIIATLAVFILLADISLEGNTVHFQLKNIRFNWNELFN